MEHFVICWFLRWWVVSLPPNLQAVEPPLVGCPRLLIQKIHKYRPYLEITSIRSLMTRHALVHLTWSMDPLLVLSETKQWDGPRNWTENTVLCTFFKNPLVKSFQYLCWSWYLLHLTAHTKLLVKTEAGRHLLRSPNGQPTPAGMQHNLNFSLSIHSFSLFFVIPPSCLLPWPLTRSFKQQKVLTCFFAW
jgi:hypothetical protein